MLEIKFLMKNILWKFLLFVPLQSYEFAKIYSKNIMQVKLNKSV